MAEKSTGQWIGAVIGAVAGFFTGGATWYAVAASMASGAATGSAIGGLIDPPKGPQIFGPRLSDLSQQMSSYGAPIPRVYGSVALMGNVFWIKNNRLDETSDTEGGGKGGGGSEVTTYSYSATFALGLCQGEIAGVRRIWISGKLIYDAGSDDLQTILASNATSSGFRVHNGSATQMPDSRMQAALGVANTPAYRGLAYIVFDDLQLADYGNTLVGAQIKVEVVNSATAAGWVNKWQRDLSGLISPFSGHRSGIPTRSGRSFDGTLGYVRMKTPGGYATTSFSTLHVMLDGEKITSAPPPASTFFSCPTWSESDYPYIASDFGMANIWVSNGGYGFVISTGLSDVELGPEPLWSFSTFGDINAVCSQKLTSSNGWLQAYIGTQMVFVKPVATGNCPRSFYDYDAEKVYFAYAVYGSTAIRIERYSVPDFMLESTVDVVADFTNTNLLFSLYVDDGVLVSIFNSSGSHFIDKFDLETFARISSVSIPSHAISVIYDAWAAENAIFRLSSYSTASADLLTFGQMSQSSGPLSAIVESEALLSSVLTASDLDTASLTDTVRGYRISATGAIRGGLEPLQGAYPFDVIQSGYKIKFSRRTGLTSLATVTKSELGARPGSDDSAPSLVRTREMDTQIPAKVTVTHLDISREYDVGEQYAERLNTTSINEHRAELALVMTAAEAAQLAETLLYMYWLERQEFSFTLPPTYRMIEPGDVITVDNGTDAFDVRLTSMQYRSDGVIECSARPHRAIYTSTALGADGPLPAGTISLPGQTEMVLLDIPTLVDVLDVPGFAVACAGYFTNWPGCVVFRSTDAGMTWSDVLSFANPSVIGYTTGTLTAPADSRMIDKASTLSVKLFGAGALSSVTEAQMLNGANHFAYGANGRWEIISAQNAVLQGDGTYLLSDMLRGRFGTEWAMGTHQAYDRLVLLNTNTLQFVASPLSGIGLTYQYRAVTFGKQLSSAESVEFVYDGENLECLSPDYLNGNRHPTTNDWSLTWLRRTRVGGEWRSYVDASLGEASEAYEVEIYSSAAYTTIKRTITDLTSAACAYTSAEQVTDFGSNQATLYVKIYQLSANVGRGQPLTTSITR